MRRKEKVTPSRTQCRGQSNIKFKIQTEILKILLRDEKLADDVDLGWLSRRTDLFSGSDLKRKLFFHKLNARILADEKT